MSDKSQCQLPSNRVSDQKAPGTDRASYQTREPIEGDEERLAMRQDLPPPVLKQVANPRFREDRAVQHFQYIYIYIYRKKKMHRATYEDANTSAWFGYCRIVFPQSVRKACSILFNNMGSFNRMSEFRKAENRDKPISSNEQFNVANGPQLSLFQRILVEQLRACDLDGRG